MSKSNKKTTRLEKTRHLSTSHHVKHKEFVYICYPNISYNRMKRVNLKKTVKVETT